MKTKNEATIIIDDEPEGQTGKVVSDIIDEAPERIVNEDAKALDEDAIPDRAILHEDGRITLPLVYPQTLKIQSGGRVREEVYEALTFHRLTGADMAAIMSASKQATDRVLIERSAWLKPSIAKALYDRMDVADIVDCQKVAISFFKNGRTTGK